MFEACRAGYFVCTCAKFFLVMSSTRHFRFHTLFLHLGNSVKITTSFRDVFVDASPHLTCKIVGTSPSHFASWTRSPPLPSSSSMIASSSASATNIKTINLDSHTWEIQIIKAKKSDEARYYCNVASNGSFISDDVFITVTGKLFN